jgi:hypothetical protein
MNQNPRPNLAPRSLLLAPSPRRTSSPPLPLWGGCGRNFIHNLLTALDFGVERTYVLLHKGCGTGSFPAKPISSIR